MKLRSYISNVAQRTLSRFYAVVAGDSTARHILDGIVLFLPGRDKRLKLAREKCLEIGHRWEILQIGLTDNCNLLCRHCFRAKRYIAPELTMRSFAFFLGNFHPDCFDTLMLSDWGEVFTIKNILGYLRYANATGWKKIELVTNASLLTDATVDAIMRERLVAHLIVSLEAATKQRYEYIRGLSWDSFLKSLALLQRKNDEYQAGAAITFGVCCFRYNLEELPKIMDTAVRYHVKTVLFVHLNPITYSVDTIKDPTVHKMEEAGIPLGEKLCFSDQHLENEDRGKVVEIFGSILEKAITHKIKLFLPEYFPELKPLYAKAPAEVLDPINSHGLGSDYVCNWPLRWVQVHLNGNVFPCCQMGRAYSMGILYANSFYNIWQSERARRFREGLRRSQLPAPICQNCNIYRGKNF